MSSEPSVTSFSRSDPWYRDALGDRALLDIDDHQVRQVSDVEPRAAHREALGCTQTGDPFDSDDPAVETDLPYRTFAIVGPRLAVDVRDVEDFASCVVKDRLRDFELRFGLPLHDEAMGCGMRGRGDERECKQREHDSHGSSRCRVSR